MIKAIVSVDRKWGIGKKNDLLFNIKKDMQQFKLQTANKIVVCGENTLLSFPGGKPLKGRTTLVLAPEGHEYKDCITYHDFDKLVYDIKLLSITNDVFIIGGAMFYKAMLPYCDEVYVTKVDAEDAEATAFYPNLDESDDFVISQESEILEDAGYNFKFVSYINRKLLDKGEKMSESTIKPVYIYSENPQEFGFNAEEGIFDPTILINKVMAVDTSRIIISGEVQKVFESFMDAICDNSKDGFNDGYTKNMHLRAEQILNGIYFENVVAAISKDHINRQSSGTFTTSKNFELKPDFKLANWVARDGKVVIGKELEAKNLADIAYFSAKKAHRALYVLINSRATKQIYLLCKLTQQDRYMSLADVFDGEYKRIPLWFWLKNLEAQYSTLGLGNSWRVVPTEKGIEIISPTAEIEK